MIDEMNRTLSKTLLGVLMIMLIFTLAACGQDMDGSSQGDDTSEQPNELEQDPTEHPTEPAEDGNEADEAIEDVLGEAVDGETDQTKAEQISIYYVDHDLMNIEEEQRTIDFSSAEEKWMSVWKALQSPETSAHVSLWEQVQLLDATLENGTLTLNLEKPEGVNIGSGGEAYAIQTLLDTYFQFDEVHFIQFTVEGEIVETLYGHVTIDEPFSKGEKLI